MTPRIASIELLAARATERTIWSFVRIADGDGVVGWGEATLNGREDRLVDAFDRLAPRFLDSPADARRDLLRETKTSTEDLPQAAIVSAIDQALWDIEGRRTGTSLAALLGTPARGTIGLYANINRRTTDRRPEGFAASATTAVMDGFDAVKVAPFDGMAPGNASGLAAGVARVAAVRQAIGPARALMVDCHWRFDASTAAAALAQLAPLGLHWFECPLDETVANFDALRALKAEANRHGILLAGCETEIGLAGFKPFIDGGIYDIIMPDVKYAGGLAEFDRIATFAAAHGVAVAPHNPSGPISHAVSLHVSASLKGFTTLEHQYDESPLFFDLVTGTLARPRGGASDLPTGPGLGLALDEAQLAPLAAVLTADGRGRG